jgi:hypothetical protein
MAATRSTMASCRSLCDAGDEMTVNLRVLDDASERRDPRSGDVGWAGHGSVGVA